MCLPQALDSTRGIFGFVQAEQREAGVLAAGWLERRQCLKRRPDEAAGGGEQMLHQGCGCGGGGTWWS